MASINNKIFLAGDRRKVEQTCGATAIKPGMILETAASVSVTPSGGSAVVATNDVVAHATAGGFWSRMIATEDALQGRTTADSYLPGGNVGGTTDNGQAVGDPVSIAICYPGAIVMGLALAGTNYTVGLKLVSDGAGRFKASATALGITGGVILGEVVDAVNLSASGAVDTLVKIRVW